MKEEGGEGRPGEESGVALRSPTDAPSVSPSSSPPFVRSVAAVFLGQGGLAGNQ